ncbi:MAG: PAS domain S-box protein [Deltaproteobacteria bacterium]
MKTKKKIHNVSEPADVVHSWEYRVDARGRLSYVSPFWQSVTGIRAEDILKDPLTISKNIHPDDLSIYQAHISDFYEKRLPGEMEYRLILPDGAIRWISHACEPYFDEKGRYAGTKGRNWDITDRKDIEHVIKVQRDLGMALDEAKSLDDSLQLCLKAAIDVSGLDAGGIYILDRASGNVNLVSYQGISAEFIKTNCVSPAQSPRTAMVLAGGKPVYFNTQDISNLGGEDLIRENLRSIAIVPFSDQGRVIGCLNVASRVHPEISAPSRYSLESIARQIGAAVARAQAEQSLRASEEKYRNIFENAVEGIFQTTPEGRILNVNQAMSKLFGYDSPADMMRSVGNVQEIYANYEDRNVFRREIESTGIVQKFEVPCVRKDGTKILIAVSARAVKDSDGRIICYDGFYEDITARKKMEDDLRESEEQLRAMFEMASIGMAQADVETGRWLRVNQKMCEISGYSADEMLALRVPEITHPEDRVLDWELFQSVVSGKLPSYRLEKRYIRKDGSIVWVNVNMTVVRDSAGRPIRTVATIEDITGRKRAEAELERSRDFIENVEDACLEMDLAGNVTFCNPSFLKSTGYTGDEYAALSRWDRHPTREEAKRVFKIYDDVYRTGIPVRSVEYKSLHKNGSTTFSEVSISLVRDKSGKPVGFRVVGRDITDRKRAEEALRESEEKFRVLVDSTPTAVALYQEDRWIYVNKAAEIICGYTQEELQSMNFWDIVHPDFRQIIREEGKKRQRGETVKNRYEFKITTKDGREKWVDLSGSSMMLQGRVAGVISVRDITERKKAEEELREAHRRLDEIIEYLPDATLVIDMDGKVIAWNKAIEQMTGIKARDMLGKGNYEYALPFYGERRPILIDLVLRPQEEGEAKYVRTERRDRVLEGEAYMPALGGGEAYLFVKASALRDSKGNIVGAIESIRDITDRRRLESQLRQAQKMEAIGTLAGGIAHDFNNILASMMGFTEMATRETRRAVRNDYLDQVLKACERAKNLVDQILAFSRQREQERRPVDIRLVLKEALGLLRATLPSTIEMKPDITGEEMPVLADPTEIHQIIMNLCTNAAHAMREAGGMLTIRLSGIEILHPADSPNPDLRLGAYAQLTVGDTGHGIDAAIKDKIFDPFFTTKKDREGTGLGLSVVYGIVKNAGGAIAIQSAAGCGTTFTVYLPCASFAAGGKENHQQNMDLRGQERILFVDDEELIVKMAKIFFESLGYSITAVTSSLEALQLFQDHPGGFDLVVTDMTMPRMTGAELSSAILKIRPELPIILCTGYSNAINTETAQKLNIRALLMKPVSLNEMGLVVRKVLDTG